MSRSQAAFGLCCLLLIVTGCGGGSDDQPDTAPVKGKVTKGNQPVKGAVVSFSPVGGGRTATAETGEDGSYELVYLRDIKGAKVGECEVRISTFQEPQIDDDGKPSGGRKEELPDEYQNGSTKRTVEAVVENVFDFAVP